MSAKKANVVNQPGLKLDVKAGQSVIDLLVKNCYKVCCPAGNVHISIFQSPIQMIVEWKTGWVDNPGKLVTAPRQPFKPGDWTGEADPKGGASYVENGLLKPGELRLAIGHVLGSVVYGDAISTSRLVRGMFLIGFLDIIDDMPVKIEVFKRHADKMTSWRVNDNIPDLVKTLRLQIKQAGEVWDGSEDLQVNFPAPGVRANPNRKARDYGGSVKI